MDELYHACCVFQCPSSIDGVNAIKLTLLVVSDCDTLLTRRKFTDDCGSDHSAFEIINDPVYLPGLRAYRTPPFHALDTGLQVLYFRCAVAPD